ncbi:MAG: CRISPR-associated endonuclease Cas2 [Gammaproteobacteria bacterium]|nr:MAG: CRISPR-associated endonuclease Cas2 [Gammaproteobacteria bacterium]
MPHADRDLYLVAYDVSDPSRLRQALQSVRAFSVGGQLSVHECWMTQAECEALIEHLVAILNPAEDRLLVVRLDPRQEVLALGRAVAPEDPDWFYIG